LRANTAASRATLPASVSDTPSAVFSGTPSQGDCGEHRQPGRAAGGHSVQQRVDGHEYDRSGSEGMPSP
jgi:hypothetical protein